MLLSLFRSFWNWLLRRKWRKNPPPPRPRPSRPAPLTLESLEDRRMLSAITTVPSPVANFPFVALGDQVMASQPKIGANIVFLGDSITWDYQYGMGAPLWSALLAGAGAVNYGVNGQTTQNLLYQLALGQLVGLYPSVIVLTIGTNNLAEGDTPQATAAGILADVVTIEQYQPKAQLIVLGVPPGGVNPSDPFRIASAQTDALVQQMLASNPRATFLNIAPAFENPDGTISSLVLFDYIHPTTLGYFDMSLALVTPIRNAFLKSLPFPVAF